VKILGEVASIHCRNQKRGGERGHTESREREAPDTSRREREEARDLHDNPDNFGVHRSSGCEYSTFPIGASQVISVATVPGVVRTLISHTLLGPCLPFDRCRGAAPPPCGTCAAALHWLTKTSSIGAFLRMESASFAAFLRFPYVDLLARSLQTCPVLVTLRLRRGTCQAWRFATFVTERR
jgi:hypothetical protein